MVDDEVEDDLDVPLVAGLDQRLVVLVVAQRLGRLEVVRYVVAVGTAGDVRVAVAVGFEYRRQQRASVPISSR
nr:hypothetical protein [Halapricum sp. CBA1109]